MYFGDPSLALAPFSNFACCCWSIWNPIASMEAIELTAAAAARASADGASAASHTRNEVGHAWGQHEPRGSPKACPGSLADEGGLDPGAAQQEVQGEDDALREHARLLYVHVQQRVRRRRHQLCRFRRVQRRGQRQEPRAAGRVSVGIAS